MLGRLIKRYLLRTPLWLTYRSPRKVSRSDVVQRCVNARNALTYLEIGVDPVPPGPHTLGELGKPGVHYFQGTSDAFFGTAAATMLARGIDVAFVDGLHTARQAYRDCVNALRYLNPGGFVLVHDCLPADEYQATPADSFEDASRILDARGVAWDRNWTGDVWKAIVALRRHPDLETHVLDCDFGIGVVRRGTNPSPLQLSDAEIEAMPFARLESDAGTLLGLERPVYLERLLAGG
jgi:hypothetical protein